MIRYSDAQVCRTVLANSRHVAEVFGRQHKNVLQAIDEMDCSDEFCRLNFQLTCEIKEIGTSRRQIRYFDMTKDGFTFLVMGFTGSTAARNRGALMLFDCAPVVRAA